MGRQRGLRPARAGIVVYVFFRRGQPKGCLYIPVSKFPACLQAPAEGKTRRFIAPEVRGHPPPTSVALTYYVFLMSFSVGGGAPGCWLEGMGFSRGPFNNHTIPFVPLPKVPRSSWDLGAGRVHPLRGGHLLLAALHLFAFALPFSPATVSLRARNCSADLARVFSAAVA